MRKWDFALLTLLIISLSLNYFIWIEIKDIKDNQTGMARRDELDRIGMSVSEAVQTLEVFAQEQKWIKDSTFILEKERSSINSMVVQAMFTFSTMDEKQQPYFLYREKGTEEWIELELVHNRLLDYGLDLNLSPLIEYEYQIITRGDNKRAGDVRQIPYNTYGAPKWKEEIEFITGSEDIQLKIYVFMNQNIPQAGMEPKNVTLKLTAYGKELQRLPLAQNNTDKPEVWNVKLKLTDPTVIDDIEAFVEVEYENGLQRTDDIELFQQRVEYEVNKHKKVLVNS